MSEIAFIELTGGEFYHWFRVDQIASLSAYARVTKTESESSTAVRLVDGSHAMVDQSPEEILDRIQELYRKANQW